MSLLVVIVIVLLLFGGIAGGPVGQGRWAGGGSYGWGPTGGIGLILVVILILALLGRL